MAGRLRPQSERLIRNVSENNSNHLEALARDRAGIPTGFTEIDIGSLVVAHYAVVENLTYDQITELTGLSRATVARRLAHAKAQGWLRERLEFSLPAEMMALRDSYLEEMGYLRVQKRLVQLLRRHGLRSVTLVSDHESAVAGKFQVSRRVGLAAARRLSDALADRPGVVGINWGRSTAAAIGCLRRPERSNPRLTFFPLTGSLSVDQRDQDQYEEVWYCSANRLAGEASAVFGAPVARRLTIPAFIARKLAPPPVGQGSEAKLDACLEMLENDVSYAEVFGVGYHRQGILRPESLLAQAETIITGLGALDPQSSLITLAKLITEQELEKLRGAGYVGDLGGHPIADPERPVSDRRSIRLAEAISGLVVSPRPDIFVRVARKSYERDDPNTGVFVIGRGVHKAAAFVAACRMGAASEVFTDKATAEKMLEILEGDRRSEGG